MRRSGSRGLAIVAIAGVAAGACGGGPRPYRLMAKTAASEESAPAQLQDHEIGLRVREALVAAGLGIGVSPHVYMGRVFLTGFVARAADAQQALDAARSVGGVRSVDGYLPLRPAGGTEDTAKRDASDLATKAELKAKLVATPGEVVLRIDIEVLAGHAVLLGVVSSEAAVADAGAAAQRVPGVTGVTNFLILPEAGYESLRPHLR